MLGKGGGWIQQVKGVGISPLRFEGTMVNVLNTQKVLLFISLRNLYFTELQSIRLSLLNFYTNPITGPDMFKYLVFDMMCLKESVLSWSEDTKRFNSQDFTYSFISERNHFHILSTMLLLAPLLQSSKTG